MFDLGTRQCSSRTRRRGGQKAPVARFPYGQAFPGLTSSDAASSLKYTSNQFKTKLLLAFKHSQMQNSAHAEGAFARVLRRQTNLNVSFGQRVCIYVYVYITYVRVVQWMFKNSLHSLFSSHAAG